MSQLSFLEQFAAKYAVAQVVGVHLDTDARRWLVIVEGHGDCGGTVTRVLVPVPMGPICSGEAPNYYLPTVGDRVKVSVRPQAEYWQRYPAVNGLTLNPA